MNRRDFSLGGLKGLAVGALAIVGCKRTGIHHPLPPKEPKAGDKVWIKYVGFSEYPDGFESEVIAAQTWKSATMETKSYFCLYPASAWRCGFKTAQSFPSEIVELIS
jgi:hypothetical protein